MKNIKVCSKARWFYFCLLLVTFLIYVPIIYQIFGYNSNGTGMVAAIGVYLIFSYFFTYGRVKIQVDEKTLTCRPFHPCRSFKIDLSRIEDVKIVQKRLGDAVVITYSGGNKVTLLPDNPNELVDLLKRNSQ